MNPGLIARRVRYDPVCEHRGPDGYCRALAITADLVPSGNPESLRDYRSRCGDHAAEGSPRVCLVCQLPNVGPDPQRCSDCLHRLSSGGLADDRGAWRP